MILKMGNGKMNRGWVIGAGHLIEVKTIWNPNYPYPTYIALTIHNPLFSHTS